MLMAFPINYRLYSSRFPWMVVLLSILICVTYFTYQNNDQFNQEKAIQYYFQSKLYQVELPAYIDYLSKNASEYKLKPNISKLELYWLYRGDGKFQKLMKEGKIFSSSSYPLYWDWYIKHRYYEYMLSLDSTNTYGFKSAEPSMLNALTSLFLHGSFFHLLGNVLFLILIGRYVEAYLGELKTILSYILLGVGSVGFYYLLTIPTLYPLVGASGAIAGLMGMFAILFQAEKLFFFVNVFFFSGVFKFKAIVFLPIWIIWECFQNMFLNTEEIAYTAHIGGFFLGAILGIIFKRVFPKKYKEDNPKYSHFQEEYKEAMTHMMNLNFPLAKKILLKLRKEFPKERAILYKLFVILKLDPYSEEYKLITKEIINLSLYDPDELVIQNEVKSHYAKTLAFLNP